jgi:hypothetical protein
MEDVSIVLLCVRGTVREHNRVMPADPRGLKARAADEPGRSGL